MELFWRKIFFFICELPLILRIDQKPIKRARYICKGTLDIEFERDWSFGLGATLGADQKIKNCLSSFRDIFGKSRYCHIVGLRINPQNLIKIVGAIFEKIKIIFFYLQGFFREKPIVDIFLGFECTINRQNFMKIVGAIFEKMKISNFFLCELPLILGVGGKLKKRLEIFTRGP